jgi:hypothetical protein
MPTKRRHPKKRSVYRGEHYWSLLWGPSPDDPKAPTVEHLRDLWESGGREDLMNSYFDNKPGFRPWSYWQFDIDDKTKRRLEADTNVINEMDCIDALGIARPGERDAWLVDQREALEYEIENVIYLQGLIDKGAFRNAEELEALDRQADEAAMQVAWLEKILKKAAC